MTEKSIPNAREAAYVAVLNSMRQQSFAADTIEQWRRQAKPSVNDFKLAQEIAYGSIRMANVLDYYALNISNRDKLSLSVREKALLRTALYQLYCTDRIPFYAIVDETVRIAKKKIHTIFGNFLNAFLRKAPKQPPILPQGDSVNALSIRYSYPEYFVKRLIEEYGLESGKEVMEAGNAPAPIMFRKRQAGRQEAESGAENYSMSILSDTLQLQQIASSSDYYIQNMTPVVLLHELSQHRKQDPSAILDLCAAPGGKLLWMHDAYPQALLYGNDVTEDKVKILRENCMKYAFEPILTISRGEEYAAERKFDIVLLDVPCSNTGVLNKRAEARWRLTEENLAQQENLQKKLLQKAASLISNEGEIWYMTCSIMKSENEQMALWAYQELGLKTLFEKSILPNQQGWDGGYACILRLK